MTDCSEGLDNQYIFTAILVIRENNKHPGIKAIKDYINKNFVSGIEGEIIEDIAMELLDHNHKQPKEILILSQYVIQHGRYSNEKQQFKNHFQQSKIKDSTLLKLKSYVEQKFDETAMKYLKENILSDIKQQLSDVAKAKGYSY